MADTHRSFNTHLIGHSDLDGHGDACQMMVKDHYLFVAHMHSAGFSVVDIADPSDPRVVAQLPAPGKGHSHKLQLVDNILLVNQEQIPRRPKIDCGGVAVYEVSDPTRPRQIGLFRVPGRGVHRMWFVDGRHAHIAATAEGYWEYIYLILDLSDPSAPREVGRWWLPGQWVAGGETSSWRFSQTWEPGEKRFMHSAIVQGDRAYLSYKDAGLIILDISDVGRPKLISHLNWCPRPQTNDVHVDADGLIYITDRVHGGLDVVEYTGPRPSSRTQAAEPAYA